MATLVTSRVIPRHQTLILVYDQYFASISATSNVVHVYEHPRDLSKEHRYKKSPEHFCRDANLHLVRAYMVKIGIKNTRTIPFTLNLHISASTRFFRALAPILVYPQMTLDSVSIAGQIRVSKFRPTLYMEKCPRAFP